MNESGTDLGDDLHGINVTDRGFRHLPPIETSYGAIVRTYESSAADRPFVWLVTWDGGDIPDDEHQIHLTTEEAARLARHLMWLVENHYQTAGRPAGGLS